MKEDRNQRHKRLGIGLLLVLTAVFFYAVFLLLVFRFYGRTALLTELWTEEQTLPKTPDGSAYDISELARCIRIDYHIYDDAGNLINSFGYTERDDDSGDWTLQEEKVFSYDDEGRLVQEEIYYPYLDTETPRFITTYEYYEPIGAYGKISRRVGTEEKSWTIYDERGRITWQDGYSYYYGYYDGIKRVESIAGWDEAKRQPDHFWRFQWDLDEFSCLETMRRESRNYLVWLDDYNEDWQRTSGVFFRGELENPYVTAERARRLGTPGYYADYYEGQLVEEMTNEYTKKVDTCQSNSYDFYDYDEAGNMIWRGWTVLNDNCLYLYQYLYNEDGQLEMELHFCIEGDWEQTLMDGSSIAFHRDGDGYLTDITRTDVNGGLMHSFLFDEEHHLAYQTDADGAVETYWQMTGEEYLAMLEEDLGETDHTDTEQGIYCVKTGDCLWRIAESLWGDGVLWTQLYEENRDLIGENPDLIYEGMELCY